MKLPEVKERGSRVFTCVICGKKRKMMISRVRDVNRYTCSKSCGVKRSYIERGAKTILDCECYTCGKKFKRNAIYMGKTGITYCSKECFLKRGR